MLPERWPHQQAELDQNGHIPKRMLCWSPRLGKSRGALDFLLLHRPERAIIAAPLVVCPQWVFLLLDAGLVPIIGFRGNTTTVAAALLRHKEGVFVVNDDRLHALLNTIARWRPSLFIGDESHRYRGVSSHRGKSMRKISQACSHVRLLTGTPTPNHLGNLWGQLVGIDRESWGSSYEKFAQKYLIRDSMFKSKVLGVLHVEELRAKLLASASILRREDVFGPDQWQTVVRDITLPPKALTLYRELVEEWVLQDSFGTDEVVSASHKLKRILRLQQLTSGFLPDDSGQVHEVHTAKIDAVFADLDEIMESGEKVVIFHRFTYEGNMYYERAASTYGADKVFRIAGDVDSATRARSVSAFQHNPGPCVFIIQTQSGGIGISLSSATHAFFVSQGFNFDDEQQARDRIYSPGSNRCVSFFRVRNSVDTFIARVLEAKADIHDTVTHADIKELAFDHIEVKSGKGQI